MLNYVGRSHIYNSTIMNDTPTLKNDLRSLHERQISKLKKKSLRVPMVLPIEPTKPTIKVTLPLPKTKDLNNGK